MKDDSLSDTTKYLSTFGGRAYSVGKQDNVYAKQIWNDAIEAAAKITEHSGYAVQIRELKK